MSSVSKKVELEAEVPNCPSKITQPHTDIVCGTPHLPEDPTEVGHEITEEDEVSWSM